MSKKVEFEAGELFPYIYKGVKYRVCGNVRMKHPVTGEWLSAIRYKNEHLAEFVRETGDFLEKFYYVDTQGDYYKWNKNKEVLELVDFIKEKNKPRYEKVDVFWDTPDKEVLQHTERDEAIEHILDGESSPLPETIEIAKYERVKLTPEDPPDICLYLEEVLDEMQVYYGNPDEEPESPTENMIKAANCMRQVIANEYVPWICKESYREEVNVKDWITKNNPERLKELTFEEDITDKERES